MPNLAAKSYGTVVRNGQFSLDNLAIDRQIWQAMDLIERINREILAAESEVQELSARVSAGETHPGLPLMLSAAESWLKDRQIALRKAHGRHDSLCWGLINAEA